MTEIIFLVEDDPEGGYTARAIGESIFTQADSIKELQQLLRDAVHCHYPDEATRPKLIRQLFIFYNNVSPLNFSYENL
ncbi:2-oxoisovalerate dehydrogenase [Limnofasciculus baicalensis]|uniref:2-oxoisovalerate dehydrogenase n=1 Tax=Limnofasciculus baicalensis BBK-W-15 TaxID=2699891 RepID=A0AAE3KMD5_9CYAN|nr:2-oxoisovalerate dehydrogenase [Limnofasciculus baicalensis]MCP2729104.1 2-oxoisovalerate dehydrogenase [Limnofasciculus baicalensis BBK-W-15]